MTIRNGNVPKQASAAAIGGKGLLLALILAGMGIQGCASEDSPADPVGAGSTAVDEVREYENGEDIVADAPAQGNAVESEAAQSKAPLAKTAPACVYISYEYSRFFVTAKVVNYCTNIQRVRLIWSHAFDGSCHTMHPRGQFWEERGRQARVSEIRGC